MPGRRRTLRRFGNADRSRSRTLTKKLTLALVLGLTACTVGEQPPCCPEPEAPPVADGGPPDVDDAVDRPERAAPVPVAVVLPRSGPPYLEQYADLVLEGVRLAVTQYGGSVDLQILDDGGSAERDGALVREAAERGVLAVIGPMLSAGMERAVAARVGDALVLLSPTASSIPPGARNAYTLNGVDLRGPQVLAEYAVRGGLVRAAILYPSREEQARQARAFRSAFEERGGHVAAMIPYDSATTTFAHHIAQLVESAPHVLYLPLSPQDVPLIAPQLAYYGFDGGDVVMLGNESWTDEAVLREVATRFTEGVIASTPSPRQAGEGNWDDFVALYEGTFRRTLDNPFPALGYDAMRLLLHAVEAGADSPAEVAERLAGTHAFRGATGVISSSGGDLTRAPFLYRVLDGALTRPPPPETLRPAVVDDAAPDAAGAPLPASAPE